MFIPEEIKGILKKLTEANFQAYIVGGCVRDLLLKKEPKDWDCTTNANPDQIRAIFPKTFLDNELGTVGVLTGSQDESLKIVEITPFRKEGEYKDKRRPVSVEWVQTIEQDLERRDFTINAMALDLLLLKNNTKQIKVVDFFQGQIDLEKKIIKAVGDPNKRFQEDALRLLRAVRFATKLNFQIEEKTKQSIKKNAYLIQEISQERIRDEFIKIITSSEAALGIELLRKLNLLQYIVPEVLEGVGVEQNKHHRYTVYKHNLLSLQYAAKQRFSQEVRIAALLHDVGKPRSKSGKGRDSTFYSHEIIGAKMTYKILSRMKFSKKEINKITKLVRYHLFYFNVDEVGLSSVRRLIRKVGYLNMRELLELRMADRIGSGVAKAEPYKLRYLQYLVEKLSKDPLSTSRLKINGNDIMQLLNIDSGPKIGYILNVLLEKILNNPQDNTEQFLKKITKKLGQLDELKLKVLYKEAKQRMEAIEVKNDQMIKQKYWVS